MPGAGSAKDDPASGDHADARTIFNFCISRRIVGYPRITTKIH
jgi:hypothetical protein